MYKIPFILISNYHWNLNHCGREAVVEYIKKDGWYWHQFFGYHIYIYNNLHIEIENIFLHIAMYINIYNNLHKLFIHLYKILNKFIIIIIK